MKKIAVIALLFLFVACESGIYRAKEPKNLLDKKEMVAILTDLTLIESSLELNYSQHEGYLKTVKNSGKIILKKYNISEKDFEDNMNYYGSNQVEMQEIYNSVLDSLNLMSGKIEIEKSVE